MPRKLPKARIPKLLALLEERYGNVTTALTHDNAFQLLVATILSAQTTDKLVNTVTPALFARYPSAQALAAASTTEVEHLIGRVNFFRNKSKNLVAMAGALCERHNGEVPHTMEELVELAGVARKTANVVLGTVWGIATGIVVDTHVLRLSYLLGLTRETDPTKVERDLMALIPQGAWVRLSHMLIHHGREVCIARRPQCDGCTLNKLCPSAFAAQGHAGKRPARAARSRTRIVV